MYTCIANHIHTQHTLINNIFKINKYTFYEHNKNDTNEYQLIIIKSSKYLHYTSFLLNIRFLILIHFINIQLTFITSFFLDLTKT